MAHNFNRTPSKEEKDIITKDLIRHERRRYIGNAAKLGVGSGTLMYAGWGKDPVKSLTEKKIKKSEQAIHMVRKDWHKPLKDIINRYRGERNYHRGNKPVVDTWGIPKHSLKVLPGPVGTEPVPSHTLIIKKKPEDFDRFVKGVKDARNKMENGKIKVMKIQLNNIKSQLNRPNRPNLIRDAARMRSKVYGGIGAALTPVAGYAAYKYHKAAQKKLNESVLQGGKYYYKNNSGHTYKIHQRNPIIAGATGAAMVGGGGVAAREGIKNAAKKSHKIASVKDYLLKPLSAKNIAIAAVATGTAAAGKHLYRNVQNKKYLPMYLGGMKDITKKEYKKNKTINPIDIYTPGSTIHERLKTPLGKSLEDKLPWGFYKMVVEPMVAKGKKK